MGSDPAAVVPLFIFVLLFLGIGDKFSLRAAVGNWLADWPCGAGRVVREVLRGGLGIQNLGKGQL